MIHQLAFYLRGRPNGGGANSVVQEFTALVRNYGSGYIVIQQEHVAAFRAAYGWDERLMSRVLTSLGDLPEGVTPVATTNDSIGHILSAWADRPGSVLYYVQDYEPLFYPPMSLEHSVAVDSYAKVNRVIAVVKTAWLKNTVLRETFMPVVQIRPSLDRSIYFPEFNRSATGRRTLLAMIRPTTPRRAPQRTLAIVNRLAEERGDTDILIFGATPEELEREHMRVHDRVVNAGRLAPQHVARIVRQSHYILDLSDYQAFGRSVAESMASGLVPIATRFGAPPEFIRHGESGYLVTPSDLDDTYSVITDALSLSEGDYDLLSAAAIGSVVDWSTDGTAADWLALARDVAQ